MKNVVLEQASLSHFHFFQYLLRRLPHSVLRAPIGRQVLLMTVQRIETKDPSRLCLLSAILQDIVEKQQQIARQVDIFHCRGSDISKN